MHVFDICGTVVYLLLFHRCFFDGTKETSKWELRLCENNQSIGMASYLGINFLQLRRINQIPLAAALKNRE